MDTRTNNVQPKNSGRSKAVRLVADLLIALIGLSAGAAIVHGMFYQQCVVKNVAFVAGVLPPDAQNGQTQEQKDIPPDLQKCLDTQQEETDPVDGFEAGVLPPEDASVQDVSNQPSAEGATPIVQEQPQSLSVTQTSAPAPQPAPAPAQAQKTTPQPVKKETPPAKTTAPAKTKPAQKTTAKKTTSSKPISVDLNKLSIAVAMQETHNCQDDRGAALLNNCHGFRKNGKFMSFSTPSESHAYFKQLWVKSYGGGFPTYRLAQIYSGNDRPDSWLRNVTYYYNKL